MGWQGVQVLACPWVPPESASQMGVGCQAWRGPCFWVRHGGAVAQGEIVDFWPQLLTWEELGCSAKPAGRPPASAGARSPPPPAPAGSSPLSGPLPEAAHGAQATSPEPQSVPSVSSCLCSGRPSSHMAPPDAPGPPQQGGWGNRSWFGCHRGLASPVGEPVPT